MRLSFHTLYERKLSVCDVSLSEDEEGTTVETDGKFKKLPYIFKTPTKSCPRRLAVIELKSSCRHAA